MRIIAGSKKKLVLFGPKSSDIRPTTDMAKESLFNLIGDRIIDADFLDLFSGTGSISLEAKSRGANLVYAIDSGKESHDIIKRNIEKSKLDIIPIKSDVKTYINTVSTKFDIIFLDPPFQISDEEAIEYLDLINNNSILNEDGIVILERKFKKQNDEIFKKYDDLEIRKYGKISFIIIGRNK